MENIGYYNGKFDLIEKMTVPMNDRAMYFGDGVYDATYSVNRTIFALEDHLDRFYNSCRLLEIPAPMPREELKKTLYECVNKVDDPNQFVYWEATRGTGIRNHVFPDTPSNLLIYTRPCPMIYLFATSSLPWRIRDFITAMLKLLTLYRAFWLRKELLKRVATKLYSTAEIS